MSTTQFRKKPVVIEAFQLPAAGQDVPDAFHDWCERVGFTDFESDRDEGLAITTLEGVMRADPGDWIIKGIKGEFYPCKPDIFAATYEPAAASGAGALDDDEFEDAAQPGAVTTAALDADEPAPLADLPAKWERLAEKYERRPTDIRIAEAAVMRGMAKELRAALAAAPAAAPDLPAGWRDKATRILAAYDRAHAQDVALMNNGAQALDLLRVMVGAAPQAPAAAQPVAWVVHGVRSSKVCYTQDDADAARTQFGEHWTGTEEIRAPAAAQAQPLTEGRLMRCITDAGCIGTVKMSFESGPYDINRPTLNATKLARAIERAHGIGGAAGATGGRA